jgi:hypothetical protein
MFWIGMSAEIEDKVGRCPTCAECRNANTSEPLIPHEMPDRPWAKIGADMCHYKGQEYLVLVDYYSKFPEVIWLSNLKAHTVITAMKSVFARFGSPEQLISDNGPPFSSAEFAKFVKFWEINHITSSPGFAQCNGQVERTVQTIKGLMKKADLSGSDFFISLLEFRNTPLDGTDGYCPSELLNSRLLRSRIPTSATLLKPHVVPPMKDKLKGRQAAQKHYFDAKANRELPPVNVGDHVRFKHPNGKWEKATVVNRCPTPRSVIVQSNSGNERVYRRNRRHLFVTKEQFPPIINQCVGNEATENVVPGVVDNDHGVSKQVQVDTEVSTDNTVTRSGRVSKPPQRLDL